MQNGKICSINKEEKSLKNHKGGIKMANESLTEVGFWNKFKNFLFQEVKVELTPYQQKIEDELNGFLHQDVTWSGVKSFLFQEIKF